MSDSRELVWMLGRTVVEPGVLYAVPGGWATGAPRACRNGHLLRGGKALVGSRPCGTHGHHRTWWCRACEYEIIWPPVNDDCRTPH
ncbi:hypothetical protein AB0L62_07890 [Nocardia asteroides]|uniref:hypothetical protein n=1 Tax=Nocardia asteroides TaxID=1824 RepID=UPI003435A2FA